MLVLTSSSQVDGFTRNKQRKTDFYLLTHAHDDHMYGLSVKNFPARKIYCSNTTRELLKSNPKYQHVIPYLNPLQMNVKHNISYRGGLLQISLIPSNHCPGSVMFLIEQKGGKNILCTGDIRAEKWWIDSIARNPILFPFTTNVYTLDNIYLDTTYGYRGEPFISMQDNYQGLRLLAFIMDLYPRDLTDKDIGFFFTDSTLGFEDVWIQTGNFFNEGFHFSDKSLKARTVKVSTESDYEFAPQLQNIIKDDKSRFHVCGKNPLSCSRSQHIKFKVKVKACIDVDLRTLMDHISPKSINDFSNLKFLYELSNGSKVYQDANQQSKLYLSPKGSDKLLTNEILYFFSRHSSFEECQSFAKLFKPKQIYPMTECLNAWRQGFQMERHFGDLCKGSENFTYDEERVQYYGPKPILADRPKTLNKFDPEGSFYKDLDTSLTNLESFKLSFRGQQSMNTAFPENSTKKDVDTQRNFDYLERENNKLMGMQQYRYQKRIHEDPKVGLNMLCNIDDDKENRFNYDDTQDSMEGNNSLEQEAIKFQQEQYRMIRERIKSQKSNGSVAQSIEVLAVDSQSQHVSPEAARVTDVSKDQKEDIASYSADLMRNESTIDTHVEIEVPDSQLPGLTVFNIGKSNTIKPEFKSPIHKKKGLDESKIKLIEKLVRTDHNFGFFDFPLSCIGSD